MIASDFLRTSSSSSSSSSGRVFCSLWSTFAISHLLDDNIFYHSRERAIMIIELTLERKGREIIRFCVARVIIADQLSSARAQRAGHTSVAPADVLFVCVLLRS